MPEGPLKPRKLGEMPANAVHQAIYANRENEALLILRTEDSQNLAREKGEVDPHVRAHQTESCAFIASVAVTLLVFRCRAATPLST